MEMLEYKIKAVNRMYRHLDRHVSTFKRRSGLACVNACGECCLNQKLDATVLEFLPAANELCLKGESDSILEQIENKKDTYCVFFNPFLKGGNCSMYSVRGLICRLFGFSVKTDKLGSRTLVTCHLIKDTMNGALLEPSLEIAPNLSSYYMRLYGIDPSLSIRYLPVNHAIKEAIEMILFDFNYRKKPA